MLRLILLAFLQSALPSVRTVGRAPSAPSRRRARSPCGRLSVGCAWKSGSGLDACRRLFGRDGGCFSGARPTAGYAVEIIRAVGNSAALIVEYVETAPSRDAITAQILTAPYHLAVVPKHEGMVTFKKVAK